MVPDQDIVDMAAHKAQAMKRGYSVVAGRTANTWSLLSPLQDYRGSFDSIENAWRAAPRDRRRVARD